MPKVWPAPSSRSICCMCAHRGSHESSCADSESFVRGGPNLITFFFYFFFFYYYYYFLVDEGI